MLSACYGKNNNQQCQIKVQLSFNSVSQYPPSFLLWIVIEFPLFDDESFKKAFCLFFEAKNSLNLFKAMFSIISQVTEVPFIAIRISFAPILLKISKFGTIPNKTLKVVSAFTFIRGQHPPLLRFTTKLKDFAPEICTIVFYRFFSLKYFLALIGWARLQNGQSPFETKQQGSQVKWPHCNKEGGRSFEYAFRHTPHLLKLSLFCLYAARLKPSLLAISCSCASILPYFL